MSSSRREYLKASAVAVTAASYKRVLGANERIRLGTVGTGGRGQYLMGEMNRAGGVEWVAVCDVYSARRDKAATIAGGPVKIYGDHRQLLEHKDIDAVIVATPDHWHAAVTIDACNAGKDVYVEKPMVHYPEHGQAVVRAAREHKCVVAVGTHTRAIPHIQEARQKFIESGMLGKIGMVRTWIDSNAGYAQKAPAGMEQKPDGLDWDRWLGDRPKVSWNPDIYFSPYKWLHYDGGMIMGIGIHSIDSAHQFLKLTNPSAAMAGGGLYFYKDGRDTGDVVNLILEYPQEVNVTFEAEALTVGLPQRKAAGTEFRGTGGVLSVLWYDPDLGYEYTPNPKNTQAPPAKGPGSPFSAGPLVRHWLECIRTRNKPVSNEVTGYYSAMACFMCNQAYRTRSRVVWDSRWDLA
jgi:predicted dehydrogenase